MERCPHCRARLNGRSSCGRCGVDLDLVLNVETEAENIACKAVQNLASGDVQTAAAQASTAHELHATLFHHALASFIKHRRTIKANLMNN